MFGMGMQELIIIGIIAILLFGKRLPEVAKSLGGTYREMRKHLNEFTSAVDVRSYINDSPPARGSSAPRKKVRDIDDFEEATAPRFEPPPAPPKG